MRADDALRVAGHLADALAARVQDVLARLQHVEREAAGAWPDVAGRAWAERASLVRRALERDLDAAAVAGGTARALLDALGPADPADPPTPDGAGPLAPPPPGPGAGTGRGGRDRGAHLGGTDADRTDDRPGMRLGTLEG
jgi:hypothetical protein